MYRHLAYRDDLTGLHNRRHFDERLIQEWSRSRRFNQPLSVVVIDLDDFKLVNDTKGHSMGDHVLSFVGKAMSRTCRDFDVPCRIGGDEFAFILPGTDLEGAEALMARVVETLDSPLLRDGFKISFSYGIAERSDATSPYDLHDRADHAMYASKRERKSPPSTRSARIVAA